MSDEEATQALRVLARHGIDAPVSQRAELIARLGIELLLRDRSIAPPICEDDDNDNDVKLAAYRAARMLDFAETMAGLQANALTSGEESA